MHFLGIDFGWTSQPSGVASLLWVPDGLRLETLDRLAEPEEVLAWVEHTVGSGPAMVGVDAPTVIANSSGMRAADRAMHVHFGRRHAGCYPANLGSAFAKRTTLLGRALGAMGFGHAPEIKPQTPGRYQIEVYPHAAMLHLFTLNRILKYKKGSVAERRAGLEQYRALLLERLPELTPRLQLAELPPVPQRGAAVKAFEDQMDALLCAYIGAWWWHWGSERTLVAGSASEGYIVVPVGPLT